MTRLHSARRNEDDGCQIVEAAVRRRALSTRSCAGPTHVGAVSPRIPISNTARRRAEAFPDPIDPLLSQGSALTRDLGVGEQPVPIID